MLNVFDIQFGSYHDGPGIRTVLFLKGCNLSCRWCQNPESQSRKAELMYIRDACISCLRCTNVCKSSSISIVDGKPCFDRRRCSGCGACAEVCDTGALQLSGSLWREEDLYYLLKQDQAFYDLSGGGVTLSGGEPLLQARDAAKLLKMLHDDGIHTAIETALCINATQLSLLVPYLNLALCDIKTTDLAKHRALCGHGNGFVRDNLRLLQEEHIPTVIRIPVIPGFNDSKEDVQSIIDLCEYYAQIKEIELIPFHRLGAGKYRALGRVYAFEHCTPPDRSKMLSLETLIPLHYRKHLGAFGQ